MRLVRIALTRIGVFALLLVASTAFAQQAEKAYSDGNSQLAKGDLRGALQSYARAVQADRANQQYAQQFLLVRRVLLLHEALEKETDPQRWNLTAQALRSFYVSRGLHEQALPLDKAILARDKSANSAIQLAETHLALGNSRSAAGALESVPPGEQTPGSRALLAIALARQGKTAEAEQVADQVTMNDEMGPGTLYLVARMQAAVGQKDRSVQVLKRCFEAVPPSRLDDLKSHARMCDDFASIAASTGFVSALKTESKVPESQCSGGSSCANCPMRGNCASGGH